jgi:hypothetical protein
MNERAIFQNKDVRITKSSLFRKLTKLIEQKDFYKKIWFGEITDDHCGRLYYKSIVPVIISNKNGKNAITICGEIYDDGRNIICILINHRVLDDPVSILIHECVHYLYDYIIKEKDIVKIENTMMQKLSWRQKRRIMSVLVKATEYRGKIPIKRLNRML